MTNKYLEMWFNHHLAKHFWGWKEPAAIFLFNLQERKKAKYSFKIFLCGCNFEC